MAQPREAYASRGEVVHLIPKVSTDITGGDVVVMARGSDPISMASLQTTEGRILPIGASLHTQWLAGVADSTHTSAIVGSTDYAAPDIDNAMPVHREGLFYLAITNTAGKEGDYVRWSSGGTGAQLFVIDNQHPGWAIGQIAQSFSGATANDQQLVELRKVPLGGSNLYYWLENRVIEGCAVMQHSAANARSENVRVGWSSTSGVEANHILLGGQLHTMASDYTLAIGDCSVTGQSAIRFRWVVARSGGFGTRTATGVHSAFASYTATGISARMMVPTTMTVGEIPIALVINFSTPQSYTTGLIHNLYGPGKIPAVGSWGI